jgi:hypothetical protein
MPCTRARTSPSADWRHAPWAASRFGIAGSAECASRSPSAQPFMRAELFLLRNVDEEHERAPIWRRAGSGSAADPMSEKRCWSSPDGTASRGLVRTANVTACWQIRNGSRLWPSHGYARQNFRENASVASGLRFAIPKSVARIRRVPSEGSTRVRISGRLMAIDMGRLEHACAPALTERAPALDIDLRRVTDLDPTARAVLGHMSRRGARICCPPGLTIPHPGGDACSASERDSA